MTTTPELDYKLNLVLANQVVIMQTLEMLLWKANERGVTWTQLRNHEAHTQDVVRRLTSKEQREEFEKRRLEVFRVRR